MQGRMPTTHHTGQVIATALAAVLALAACSTTSPSTPSSSTPGSSTPGSSGPAAPSAPGSASSRGKVSPDFDGDAGPDLVVGVGGSNGQVSVRYANGRSLDFGTDDKADDHPDFGQALLARDLNGDGLTDLVVADPSTTFGSSLTWLFGSADGLDPAARQVTPIPDLPNAGRALALLTAPKPVLVVGGGTAKGSPVMVAYTLGADGLPAGEPQRITPDSLGLPSIPAGSRFGSTLAATGSLLVVGAPSVAVGSAPRAGAIYTIDAGETPWHASRFTQDSPGVPDNAQEGDRFGAALSIGEGYLAVGVPGEDRDGPGGRGQARAGLVQPFALSGHDLVPLPAIDQDPGKVEAGDGFGTAVTVLEPCPGGAGVLVGAPAEAIGSTAQAGSIWVIPIKADQCWGQQFWDGQGLGAKAHENTLVGSAVSVLRLHGDGDTLVIAAPGVSEEGVRGRVLMLDFPYQDAPVEALAGLSLAEERTIALSPPEG